MSSKVEILAAIRSQLQQAVELPSLDEDWITYDNPLEQFRESLAAVGGNAIVVENVAELDERLAEIEAFSSAKKTCSLVAGVGRPNVDLDGIVDAHDLEDIDFAILPGKFGVAENAAVWITDAGVKHRVIYFLTQHLALVIPADAIVNNMHEAYSRLEADPEFSTDKPGFGTFISGPSKTADIEQSLVIGAHGARSLTVFLLKTQSPSDDRSSR
ncbi:MAG: LUD domain-containing protein [Planctomycetota bacterium]|nr:LUD domain-containing protein [Planctomycetota bacterium]